MPPRPPKRRSARILPTLAVLFALAGAIRLVSGVGVALAQDPAPTPSLPPDLAAAEAARQPLRSSPVSDARLALQIRDRERAVTEREAQLQAREAEMAETEARILQQTQDMQTAEAALTATMALADRAAEDDIQRLVTVFEAMDAEEAAAVFAEMDPGFAAGFLARLQPEIAAAILAGLEPRQAYGLSAIVAGRNALVPRP